jgi:hypothetical protein
MFFKHGADETLIAKEDRELQNKKFAYSEEELQKTFFVMNEKEEQEKKKKESGTA